MSDVETPAVSGTAVETPAVPDTVPTARPIYASALAKMESRRYASLQDRATTEIMVVGTHAFDRFTPKKYGDHAALFSMCMSALIVVAWAYTAGGFLGPGETHGPTSVRKYFFDTVAFDASYLRQWGALFGPATKRQAYRLVTYAFVHQTFVHLLGNLLVFGLVSFSLEHR